MRFLNKVVLVAVLLFSNYALADEAAEQEAEKLMDAMGMETLLEQSVSQMLDVQLQQNPTLSPFKGVMMKFLNKHMSYASIKPDMVQIYANAFTAAELKEINAFYHTKVGQKTIKLMPDLMAQGGQIGAQRVQSNIQELQTMIQAESERLQKLQSQ